jgi:prolipoprotein diacylglyceryltransferase
VALARLDPRRLRTGDLFRLYVFGYMALRFALEFLKDGYRVVGLTSLQWAALGGILWCSPALVRRLRRQHERPALAVEGAR